MIDGKLFEQTCVYWAYRSWPNIGQLYKLQIRSLDKMMGGKSADRSSFF